MAKNDKAGVDQIVKKVNREFEKTSSQLESMISEALKQIDHLQNQIQEPIRKLLDDVEKMRGREMKRFHDEFERRLHEFHQLQNSILERIGAKGKSVRQAVGMESKGKPKSTLTTAESRTGTDQSRPTGASKTSKTNKPKTAKAKTAAKPRSSTSPTRKTAATKSPASPRRSASSKPAATAKSTSTASSSTRAGSQSKASASQANGADLTRIKGIGPAIAKKMQAKGITRIQQLADPNAEDRKALESFSSMKGFDRWRDEAKQLV